MSYSVSAKSLEERLYIKPAHIPFVVISGLILLSFAFAVYHGFISHALPDWSAYTCVILFGISFLVYTFVAPKNYTVGFLVSLLPYLAAWDVAYMTKVWPIVYVAAFGAIAYVIQFFDTMNHDTKNYKGDGALSLLIWQMAFLRIFFGFNETGHFVEKLFAGDQWFGILVSVFTKYGLADNTSFFVVLAGCTELLIAIGIGMGLFTRFAGALGVVYIFVANSFGQHHLNGYTWSSRAISDQIGRGGWEYVALLIVFFGSFMIYGAGKFSLDRYLISKGLMPKFLLPFCITKATQEELLEKK
ncbi:MAG: DoxX family protein [Campylobacteraceae bacterium]